MAFDDPGVVIQDHLVGLNQRQISLKIDTYNQKQLMEAAQQHEEQNPRFLSRLVSNTRPHTGDWLNAVPNPALGLYLQPQEFAFCAKYCLGLDIYQGGYRCPACDKALDLT